MDDAAIAGAPLRPPERMRRDREAALVVDGVQGRRRRHARPHAPLQEEAEDVSVAARHLLPDHDLDAPGLGRALGGAEGAFERVVVGDRDHSQIGAGDYTVDELRGRRPAVRTVRMHVQVGSRPRLHCSVHATASGLTIDLLEGYNALPTASWWRCR